MVYHETRIAAPPLALNRPECAKDIVRRPVQRCLVHKCRNLESYVRKGERGEVRGYFERLRKVQGEEAAREVLGELERFLKGVWPGFRRARWPGV